MPVYIGPITRTLQFGLDSNGPTILQRLARVMKLMLKRIDYYISAAINTHTQTQIEREREKSDLKKTSSWATVGPAKDNHQAPTNGLKLTARAVIAIKKEAL